MIATQHQHDAVSNIGHDDGQAAKQDTSVRSTLKHKTEDHPATAGPVAAKCDKQPYPLESAGSLVPCLGSRLGSSNPGEVAIVHWKQMHERLVVEAAALDSVSKRK